MLFSLLPNSRHHLPSMESQAAFPFYQSQNFLVLEIRYIRVRQCFGRSLDGRFFISRGQEMRWRIISPSWGLKELMTCCKSYTNFQRMATVYGWSTTLFVSVGALFSTLVCKSTDDEFLLD
ncbi:Uncharacterized protein TCM_011193 [Theobroma cacao]|uniref:Uncharacterized protein n=1 Tax=Theobroma cacao TaxID=3641 RepID=A0A061E8D6_THECC|nr:Uncharacterized protein TCM_011193 [Theobroma cacao]